MSSLDLYQQHPIPQGTESIRLLRLTECIYTNPDGKSLPTALRCSFEIHDLAKAPSFVALSYTWGSKEVITGVLSINGENWPLRENLCDGMLHIWDERGRKQEDHLIDLKTRSNYVTSRQEVSK